MADELSDFLRYATAFEDAFAADDWRIVDQHFDDEIAWSCAGLAGANYMAQGRAQVSAAIKQSVDTFDRRFDLREPQAVGVPAVIPGGIHLDWRVVYSREGLPSFELRGAEWDLFRDGKLVMHHERVHNGVEALEFIARHDAALRPRR